MAETNIKDHAIVTIRSALTAAAIIIQIIQVAVTDHSEN
jgi:hypothetical protein